MLCFYTFVQRIRFNDVAKISARRLSSSRLFRGARLVGRKFERSPKIIHSSQANLQCVLNSSLAAGAKK